jgi:hypothetical protein
VNRLYAETPVLFGRDQNLVGVACRPATAVASKPFVILLNAGIIHRSGPNRMSTRLARALAHVGVPSLRFDLSGVGDSVVPAQAAAMPIQDRVRQDIDDAMAYAAERHDARTFIVGGLCSGADNALRTAARRDDVVGVITLDLNVTRTRGYWLRHYARRFAHGDAWRNLFAGRNPELNALLRRWRGATAARDGALATDGVAGAVASLGAAAGDACTADLGDAPPELEHDAVVPRDEMRGMLDRLVARDVALLCVFSGGIPKQYNYARQFLDLFPGLDFGDRLRLLYVPEADHTFTGPALQERLRRSVVGWVSETAFRAAGERSGRAGPAPARRYSLTPRSLLRRRGMPQASGS